jgi:hypothetical protein
MANDPIWRASFDAVERMVGSQVGRITQSEAFAVALGLAHTVQRDVRRRSEHVSRRVLHTLNLPAGSDITRLLAQMGSVQRQVRDLEKRLEDAVEGSEGEVMFGASARRSDGGPRADTS